MYHTMEDFSDAFLPHVNRLFQRMGLFKDTVGFYPRDAMLARFLCLLYCTIVRLSLSN